MTDERYLWRLRRAAERLRGLVRQFEAGTQDADGLHALNLEIGTLTYYVNLANMEAARRRPEDTDDEIEPMGAGGRAALRRAS